MMVRETDIVPKEMCVCSVYLDLFKVIFYGLYHGKSP